MSATTKPVTDRIASLSDPEQAYIARYIALAHPEIAEEGLEALAVYRHNHPKQARQLLGAFRSWDHMPGDGRNMELITADENRARNEGGR
jgi:hypothetical protein